MKLNDDDFKLFQQLARTTPRLADYFRNEKARLFEILAQPGIPNTDVVRGEIKKCNEILDNMKLK